MAQGSHPLAPVALTYDYAVRLNRNRIRSIIMQTIVLAYSGGLDTSIIVPWLKEHYDARVICVAGDVGQGEEELRGVREKALASGADECYVEDGRKEFVEEFIWT